MVNAMSTLWRATSNNIPVSYQCYNILWVRNLGTFVKFKYFAVLSLRYIVVSFVIFSLSSDITLLLCALVCFMSWHSTDYAISHWNGHCNLKNYCYAIIPTFLRFCHLAIMSPCYIFNVLNYCSAIDIPILRGGLGEGGGNSDTWSTSTTQVAAVCAHVATSHVDSISDREEKYLKMGWDTIAFFCALCG